MDGNTETCSKYAIENYSIKSTADIPVLWIPAIPAGMTIYRRHLCIRMRAPAWEAGASYTEFPSWSLGTSEIFP
jgi:hypothetical protein